MTPAAFANPLGRRTPPASLRRRLASLVYESVLLAAVLLAAAFAVFPFTAAVSSGESRSVQPLTDFGRLASFVWHLTVAGGYFVWMWSGGRRTLAMRTWRMRLVTASGDTVDTGRALARFAASTVGPLLAIALHAFLAPLGLAPWAWLGLAVNFAWALADSERAFLHDRLAGTRLLDAGDESPVPDRFHSVAIGACDGTRGNRRS